MVPLDKGLQCKTKAIQTNLGTFRHNQTYPGIIQAYSDIFGFLSSPDIFKTVYIQNPNIFRTRSIIRTLTYSQLCYIQNPTIFRTLAYSKSEVYSEPLIIFTAIIIFTNCNYFHKACLVEINILR